MTTGRSAAWSAHSVWNFCFVPNLTVICMKRCGKCGRNRRLTSFHKRGKIHQAWCKDCVRENDRARYQANPQHRRDLTAAYNQRNRVRLREVKQGPCTDCGLRFHPAAMQFDHIGTDKTASVSDMVRLGYRWDRIKEEIDKCELVCANCHAVRTYQRREEEVSGSSLALDARQSRGFESHLPDSL